MSPMSPTLTRTIFLPKSSSFHPIRLGLKATLVSSLLILGHVLMTTTAHAPTTIQLTPSLPGSISTLSALIFLTLLWITFTLIEGADLSLRSGSGSGSGSDERGEVEKGMVFSRTWVEGLCGLVVFVFWAAYWRDADRVMDAYSHQLAGEFALIPLTYFLTLLSLLGLNAHLVLSIACHAVRNGTASLATPDFWAGKMGWWVGRVELGLVVSELCEGATILEKGEMMV